MFTRSTRSLGARLSGGLTLLIVLFAAAASWAQGLSEALGGCEWGQATDDVLEVLHDTRFDEYRTEIAGLNDPLVMDRMRREAQEDYDEIEGSLEIFDGETGYEISVLGSEIAAGESLSMVTRRGRDNNEYFIFRSGRLAKLVVTYDMESLGWVSFDEFVESLEPFLGLPDEDEWEDDEYGIPHLLRVAWNDGVTRLRVENRASLFNSYILVYTNAAIDDFHYDVDPVQRARRSRRGGSVLDIAGDRDDDYDDNTDIVDSIIGGRPDVEFQIEEEEEEDPFWAEDEAAGGSAMDDDEELAESEREERRRRRREREREEEEEEQTLEIR